MKIIRLDLYLWRYSWIGLYEEILQRALAAAKIIMYLYQL